MTEGLKYALLVCAAFAAVVVSQHFISVTPDGAWVVWVRAAVMVVGSMLFGYCVFSMGSAMDEALERVRRSREEGETETLEQVCQNYHLAKDIWQHTFMQLRDINMDTRRELDALAELLDEAYGELSVEDVRDGPRCLLLTRIEHALGKKTSVSDLNSDREGDHV